MRGEEMREAGGYRSGNILHGQSSDPRSETCGTTFITKILEMTLKSTGKLLVTFQGQKTWLGEGLQGAAMTRPTTVN